MRLEPIGKPPGTQGDCPEHPTLGREGSRASQDAIYRAVTYVDKILKGSKPADLPVEQVTSFVWDTAYGAFELLRSFPCRAGGVSTSS